jgi:predicted metal-binding membrane protein
MTAAAITAPLVRASASHPGWWALLPSAAAWIVLFLHPGMPQSFPLCVPASPGSVARIAEGLRAAWQTQAITYLMIGWSVMAIAMVPPLAMGLLRHVSVRSFQPRRHRAIAEFLGAAMVCWLLAGLAALPLVLSIPMSPAGQSMATAGAFGLAALWQLTPMKRSALRRCHRTFPLAPHGWQADRDCLRYGFTHGAYCVASCWAMMLAAMLSVHASLAMLFVQVIAIEERREREPPRARAAIALLACGILSALSGVVTR